MGLREIKKERTRRSIQEVAMRLFKKSGYDATSVEQIAAAAEVSPATFYRYYKDKEEVVLAMNVRQMLDTAIKSNLPGTSFTSFIRTIFDAAAEQHIDRREFLLNRYRLIQSVPGLKAGLALERQAYVASTCREFADHHEVTCDEYDLRMLFTICGAVITDTIDYWVECDGKPEIRSLLDRGFLNILPILRDADSKGMEKRASSLGRRIKKST